MNLMRRLSVQSRLVVLLLTVSLSSIVVIGYVAYCSATAAFTQRAFAQLEGLRRTRAERIHGQLELVRNQVITLSETGTVVEAIKEFRGAFAKLHQVEVTAEQDARLRDYYENQFLNRLKRNTDGEPVLETYFPTRAVSRYLQYHYIAVNPYTWKDRGRLEDPKDGSAYTEVHKKYHPYFQRFAQRFGFRDILLINPDNGDVLYTNAKTTELGRNIYTGPYAQSNLAGLVRSLRKQSDRKTFRMTDFEPYLPNMGRPYAFVASPVFEGAKRIGVVVLQFPVELINRIVTGNNNWERDGLGSTGEVYVVGEDHLLRTTTRRMEENAESYCRSLRQAGYSASVVEKIQHIGSPILLQNVRNKAVERALLGEEGTTIYADVGGGRVLTSYGPLSIDGLNWVIVAKIDVSEVYAPAYLLGRRILLVLVVVALLVSGLAIVLARVYVRPIQQIREGVRALGQGQTDVKVYLHSEDEFRELADAFNEMSSGLKSKTEQLQQKIRENEELLLNILPGPAAMRLRDGSLLTPDTFADVTVLLAEVVGFPELDEQLPTGTTIQLLNELIGPFDELAERYGVEKMKTMGMSYLAVCGLSVSRVDHVNRVVEFAQEMLRVVQRFNQEHGRSVALRVGIHSGPVVGGVVGRSKFIYELWGATVNIARGLNAEGSLNTIHLSAQVQEKLGDLYEFERQPEIQTAQRRLSVWSIKSAA